MEGRMQQTAEKAGTQAQASAEGACRLGMAEHMRTAADGYTGITRSLLLRGADEIERLRLINEDYARICQASCKEIEMLRRAVARERIVVVDGKCVED